MSTKSTRPARIKVLTRYCKGCGLCVTVCKKGVIKQEGPINEKGYRTVIITRPEECTLCQNCLVMCPDAAIELIDNDKDE
jgi:2-oxoglutarate ferredoxin oxidoreductase subunit delta